MDSLLPPAVLAGCGAASGTKPLIYRGAAHGVDFTLSVHENASTSYASSGHASSAARSGDN